MPLGSRLLLFLSTIVLVLGWPSGSAGAAEPVTTTVQLDVQSGYADAQVPLAIRVAALGSVVPDGRVDVQRRVDGTWTTIASPDLDAEGRATVPVRLARTPGSNRFLVAYVPAEGSTFAPSSATTAIDLVPRASRLVLGGPGRVIDGRSVPLKVRWTTRSGQPVAGTVRVYRSLAGSGWRQVRSLHTDAGGRAEVEVAPRQDSRWKARGIARPWVEGAASPVHAIENLPPGVPVRLPPGAPHPRRDLPAQPRAAGAGAHLVITALPASVWSSMTGVSWHRGCPVGRSSLRLVRVSYWDYHGYPRRGELVANVDAARAMGAALAEMYRRKLPVRAMWRVDRFGWGARSHGGDDYASMAAGNTSAFNCRDVTGRPGVRSPHSYGRSLDLNTWENPYRSARGIVPNTWWQSHSHPRVAWRSRSHAVVRVMARHGLRWTYGLGDTQHFDYVGSRARATVAPRPCDRFCD